ncbi:MAG: T9SS C-terminal target domain-containing protein [Balneola sp.]|nr:MAG: T9SS C-terminal target domain-containing protein [Balneola sp.]
MTEKKLLLLLFLGGVSFSGNAQEKYFHDLKGIEDSVGVTHLFYRIYEEVPTPCPFEEDPDVTLLNNVFHFNTSTQQDSIKFDDYYNPWCLSGHSDSERVWDYGFYENDPSKWVKQPLYQGCFPPPVVDYRGRKLTAPGVCLTKQRSTGSIDLDSENGFILSNKEDSLYYNESVEGVAFRVSIEEDFNPNFFITTEEEYAFFYHYLDSVGTEFGIQGIHPVQDSLFYSINDMGHLFISEYYTARFKISDSTASYQTLSFDSEASVLYAIVTVEENEVYRRSLKRSEDFGRPNSWANIPFPEEVDRLQFLVTDSEEEGTVLIADSTTIYLSSNFGESFEFLTEIDSRITGLYKKPKSSLLYTLSEEELFEVNTQTGTITSIKKLPVSNEVVTEVPNSVVLHQNYPNPFNPVTNITFELNKTEEVKLSIYDVLGRSVATLVDERRSAGLHTLSFDASNLPSGIYFYRLETKTQSLVKKLTLLK